MCGKRRNKGSWHKARGREGGKEVKRRNERQTRKGDLEVYREKKDVKISKEMRGLGTRGKQEWREGGKEKKEVTKCIREEQK